MAQPARPQRRFFRLGLALLGLGLAVAALPAHAQVNAGVQGGFNTSGAGTPAPEAAPAPGPAQPAAAAASGQAAAQPSAPAAEPSVPGAEAPPEAPPKGDTEAPPESRDAQLLRAQNTWFGPVGGLHVVDAGSGPAGTLRLQLGVDFFISHDFLLAGDTDDYSGGTLSLSWTLTDYFELYGSVANHANYNNQELPQLLQVLGDTLIGAKGFHALTPWLTLGGDLRFAVLNTVGDIGPVLSAMSFGFRGNTSADLRQLDEPVPLIARFSLDYYFDNSANLIEDVENQRYAALGADRRPRADEDRNLIRRVERFGLGINRTDALGFALGLEAPLRAARDFFIHPLLEWTLQVPVNRQGYSCLLVSTGAGPADPDGCLKTEGFAAMPSTLTLGARLFPPVRGLSFALGLDLALSGSSVFVRELAGNKPYDVLLALSYAIDARERPASQPQTVEVVREVPKPLPPNPRVQGAVVDAATGAPVAGATIAYPGLGLTAQQADEQGLFVSYELPPGEARLDVSHPDYDSRTCSVEIPKPAAVPAHGAPATTPAAAPAQPGRAAAAPAAALGQQPAAPASPPAHPTQAPGTAGTAAAASGVLVPLRCELTAKPRAGGVRGLVLGEGGKHVAGAHVDLIGPTTQSLVTDDQGQFVVVSAVAGSYGARIEADGYLIRLVSFDVAPGGTATPEITLLPKPKRSQVELTKQEVRIHKQIFFNTNSAQISEKSNALLSEIADVLLRNPQVKLVEIQGHTDSTGSPDVNMQLSQSRAEAVRKWLIEAGVDASRLVAKGYGDTRPLVPNLTDRNRARNRRVQFIIKEQE